MLISQHGHPSMIYYHPDPDPDPDSGIHWFPALMHSSGMSFLTWMATSHCIAAAPIMGARAECVSHVCRHAMIRERWPCSVHLSLENVPSVLTCANDHMQMQRSCAHWAAPTAAASTRRPLSGRGCRPARAARCRTAAKRVRCTIGTMATRKSAQPGRASRLKQAGKMVMGMLVPIDLEVTDAVCTVNESSQSIQLRPLGMLD